MNMEPFQDLAIRHYLPTKSRMTCGESQRWKKEFIGWAVRSGLLSYIETRLKVDKSLLSGQHETLLLLYAVIPGENGILHNDESFHRLKPWSHEVAGLLLKYGANPNQLVRAPRFLRFSYSG
jgi:hypothetical protein